MPVAYDPRGLATHVFQAPRAWWCEDRVAVYGTARALSSSVNATFSNPSIEVVFDDVQEALARAAKITRRLPRPKRWPVLFCGIIAIGFAAVAFTRSPLAENPRVKPYVDRATSQVVAVIDRYR